MWTEDSVDSNPPLQSSRWTDPEASTLYGRTESHTGDTTGVPSSRETQFGLSGLRDTVGAPPAPPRRPLLVIIDGKRVSDRFVLDKDAVVIGREVDCDLSLQDGRISRRHTQICWSNRDHPTEDPLCFVEDMGSRNGTVVNGQKIEGRQPLRDGDRILLGTTLVGFYIKDEQELSLDQKLFEMATTDGLTGLSNRLFFQTESRREIERARRYDRSLCLMVIDLDHFKNVNDTHGHAAGDVVLRQFARLLTLAMRDGDILGRLGGEEFGALLPETDLKGAVATAERLRKRVEQQEFRYNDQVIQITVSVGVAAFGAQYTSRQAFFEAADKALYQAKQEGRNQVCAAPSPSEKSTT